MTMNPYRRPESPPPVFTPSVAPRRLERPYVSAAIASIAFVLLIVLRGRGPWPLLAVPPFVLVTFAFAFFQSERWARIRRERAWRLARKWIAKVEER
jgi:hypothetical protein